MMNRTLWKFSYQANKLLEAAEIKHNWHEGRLNWWVKKREEIKDKIRSEGIEIDESVANNDENYKFSTAHRGTSVNIRNDLLVDLNECISKVKEHQAKIRDYNSWIQVLASQGQSSFDLNQDDWLFFFVR